MNFCFWLLVGATVSICGRLLGGKNRMNLVVFLAAFLLARLIYGWSPIFSVVLVLILSLLLGYYFVKRKG